MSEAVAKDSVGSAGPSLRRRWFRRNLILVSLAGAVGFFAWGWAGREGLRERWLAAQSMESLQRMDTREDGDTLAHFVYANRLNGAGGDADAWPPAARAASAIPLSSQDPLSGRVWALAGCLAAQYGDAQQAETYLKAAERLRPQDARVYLGQGILAARRHQAAAAIGSLTHATELDPGLKDAWRHLGAAYLLVAETDEAEGAFLHVARLAPREAKTHADLADVYARLGRFDRAFAEAQEAAGLAPDAPETSTLPAIIRASSARTQEGYEEAILLLNAAMAKFPNVSVLHALLAGLHVRFNRFALARKEAETFLARAPKDANGWLSLSTICERLGDRRGADSAYARYQWIIDANAEATRLKQQSLLRPSDATVYLQLAKAMDRCGKYREAVEALERAGELKPEAPEIPRMLAEAQATLRAAGEAAELNRPGDGPR